ncbi:transcriptional regulator [Fibrobacterota bacterium]
MGSDPDSYQVNPCLIASKLTSDAVLGYHTALEFHGKAYTVFRRYYYISSSKSLPLEFQSNEFLRAPVPPSLQMKNKAHFGTSTYKISGVDIRVTDLERTFVDVLDRTDLGGGLEEVWRSLESIEFFDMDKVIKYVRLLSNSTTAARVGFFLDRHRESLMIEEKHLKPLRKLRPGQPHYFERGKRKDCQFVKDWNLLVPVSLMNKSWEEVL